MTDTVNTTVDADILDGLDWFPIDNAARDGQPAIVRNEIGDYAAARWVGSRRRDSRGHWSYITPEAPSTAIGFEPAYYTRERVDAFAARATA